MKVHRRDAMIYTEHGPRLMTLLHVECQGIWNYAEFRRLSAAARKLPTTEIITPAIKGNPMKPILLLLLVASTFALDPFDTPALKQSEAACLKAEIAYRDALIAAWYDAKVKPFEIPAALKDPKQSEMVKLQAIGGANQYINQLNDNFKRWSKPLEGRTVAAELARMQEEVKNVMEAIQRAEKAMK